MYTNMFVSNKLANLAMFIQIVVIIIVCSSMSSSTSLAAVINTHFKVASGTETEHFIEPHKDQVRNRRDELDLNGNTPDVKITESEQVPPKKSELEQITPAPNGNGARTTSSKYQDKVNCSQLLNANKTECKDSTVEDNTYGKSILTQMTENRGMLLRTLYVTLGVTGIVVVYFVARSFWLRRSHTKSRKYGVMTQSGNHRDMEMEPLGDGNDDDDDDYTVFEAGGGKK